MKLMEARRAGERIYTGKTCKRHPELKGRRRASNGLCTSCKRDYNKARQNRLKDGAR